MAIRRRHRHSAIATFGQRVRAHRLAAGFSQPELSRRARVGAKFIGEIERGIGNPSLETMALVADGLGCDLAELVRSDSGSRYVAVPIDNLRRAQEALAVIASALTLRKRAARRR